LYEYVCSEKLQRNYIEKFAKVVVAFFKATQCSPSEPASSRFLFELPCYAPKMQTFKFHVKDIHKWLEQLSSHGEFFIHNSRGKLYDNFYLICTCTVFSLLILSH